MINFFNNSNNPMYKGAKQQNGKNHGRGLNDQFDGQHFRKPTTASNKLAMLGLSSVEKIHDRHLRMLDLALQERAANGRNEYGDVSCQSGFKEQMQNLEFCHRQQY